MKCRLALAALAVLLIAGCGSTVTVTQQVARPTAVGMCSVGQVLTRTGHCIPIIAIHARPETARTPDGAKPQPPAGLGLFGSSIRVSTNGLQFIEGFEGWSSCPYWDGYGGVWTRGYGETEGISGGSACISRSFGENNLRYRLERFYGWAVRGLGVDLNQNQADALYSFAWNLGAGIFTGSLRYSLQHHNPYPLLAYDHAGGVRLEGLTRRRRAEVALFLSGAPAPPPPHHTSRAELVRRLHRDYRSRSHYKVLIDRHSCRLDRRHHSHAVPHTHAQWKLCQGWLEEGQDAVDDIKVLHRHGVY